MTYGQYRGPLAGAIAMTALMAVPSFAQTAANAPTFTKDVAPIFQAKCESCHRPDSIAPMSLVTYEQSRPWARSIRDRVQTRQMPPWHIDKTLGIQHFENDRSLSDAEIDTIVKWVAAGAPKGDMKDMPKPVEWPSDRRAGTSRRCTASPTWSSSRPPTPRRATRWTRGTSPCVRDRPHRRPLGARHRDAPAHREGPQDHPPRAGPPAAERRRHRRVDRARRRRPGPGPVHGMGRRQAGRDHARELGQADEARLEDRVGHPLPRRR